MDISSIEPNSNKYKAEKALKEARKLEKVVSGKVSRKRRTLVDRFRNTFVKENPTDVKKYVLQEVIIPAIIDGVYDVMTSSFEMMFRGSTSRKAKKSLVNSLGSRINYGGFFSGGERKERISDVKKPEAQMGFENLCFESKGEAEIVLDNMVEILNSEYKQVTVADFYELAGFTGEFTDYDFGWKDLSGAKVKYSRDGYYIDLPRCISLK